MNKDFYKATQFLKKTLEAILEKDKPTEFYKVSDSEKFWPQRVAPRFQPLSAKQKAAMEALARKGD